MAAETKRNSTSFANAAMSSSRSPASSSPAPAGGAASHPPQAQGSQDLITSLSKATGSRIRITPSNPKTAPLEGTLFAVSTTAKVLALSNSSSSSGTGGSSNRMSDYHILPLSAVRSFAVVGTDSTDSSAGALGSLTPDTSRIDWKALRAREAAAVARLRQREEMQKKGVSREAQELFEAISKTLPIRWQDTSMVVNDSVLVAAPYRAEDAKAPKDQQHQLERVKRVLDHERRKLAQRNSSNAANAKGQSGDPATTQRKGG